VKETYENTKAAAEKFEYTAGMAGIFAVTWR
jgi:hypothetical protein